MKTAYQCYASGEYIGPMEVSSGILPNGATWTEPPAEVEGFVRFYRNGEWEQVEDHRGEKYWLLGDAWDSPAREMTDFGPLPAGAQTEPPAQPEEVRLAQLQKQFTDAIQRRLDAFAQERGYDGIMSACSYYGSDNPRFKPEADRAIALRDATWAAGYELLDAVLSGARPMPTIEEVFAELPELTWE